MAGERPPEPGPLTLIVGGGMIDLQLMFPARLPVVQAGDGFGPGRVIAERRLVLARRDGAAVDPATEMLVEALRN